MMHRSLIGTGSHAGWRTPVHRRHTHLRQRHAHRASRVARATTHSDAAITASSPDPARAYLQSRLALGGPALQQLPDGLSVERDVAPNVDVLLSLQSPQRVAALLRSHPELLAAPLPLWKNFLMHYGISSRFFCQLLRTHPHVFTGGSVFRAGQNLMFLQSLGLTTRDIAAHVIPRAAGVLDARVSAGMQPVVHFLAGATHNGHGLGLTPSQIISILSRCPRVLLMSVEADLQPRLDTLRHLGLTHSQAAHLLFVNSALLLSPLQPQLASHLQFLTATCGFSQREAVHIMVECTDFLVHSIGNLERKWAFLTRSVYGPTTAMTVSQFKATLGTAGQSGPALAAGHAGAQVTTGAVAQTRAGVLGYPAAFGKALADIGPRFCFARDQQRMHHLLEYSPQSGSVSLSLRKLLDGDVGVFLTVLELSDAASEFEVYAQGWRRTEAGRVAQLPFDAAHDDASTWIESSW